MVTFFHQQGITGIGAESREGGQPGTIHEDACVGHVFGAVEAFTVNVGKENAATFCFGIEVVVAVAVQQFGRVQYVSGAGNFNGRGGGKSTNGTTGVEADHHGLALHDALHVFGHISVTFTAHNLLGHGAGFFVFVDDVEGLVHQTGLLFRKIEVNGVTFFSQSFFFTFFQ